MNGADTFERRVVLDKYAKWIWVLRRQPSHAAWYLTGIVLPAHERYWLGIFFSESKENTIVASRGTSKCLAVGTRVIMADGTLRAVEDVRVGDQVMGPDSRPRTVLHTTRGRGPLYRVKQTSGIDYVVNEDHILSLRKSRSACQRKNGVFAQWPGEVVNIGVKEFAAQTPYTQAHLRGYRAGLLKFPERSVSIDPYLLGVWLGDGCGRNLLITTADPEIIDYCHTIAEREGARVTIGGKSDTKAKTVRITYGYTGKAGNRLWDEFKRYGITNPRIGRGINNKHIPDDYLYNSEDVRLALLAGLLDADGHVDHGGYLITQTKELLARQIKFLADSLGFRTSIRSIKTSYGQYQGETWAVYIGGDVWRIPCRVAGKQIKKEDLRKNKNWLLSQVSVEPAGEGEWAGFIVDGDHLFLLEDGTVTHNSFSHGSLAAPLRSALFKNLNIALFSASGFRGGKELFNDAARLIEGRLKSQDLPGVFLMRGIATNKTIRKDPSMWAMEFRSHSRYATVPTNNDDQLRGLRANIAIVDERNTFDGTVVHKTIRPMMNVGSDFKRTATGGDKNQIFSVGTIDYTIRDWWPEIQYAQNLAKRQYDAIQALKMGDYDEYDRLMNEGDGALKDASFSYSRIDYTDLLIPEYVEASDGKVYRVELPLLDGIEREDVLRYDERDRISYWYLYPVDKQGLEEPLRNGTTDPEIWRAEQRNIPISAAGNVFEFDLIRRVSEKPIYDAGNIPGYEYLEDEFYAPVMFSCGDPCVIGVDYARESDETAFVIIRLGELADKPFDPTASQVDEQGRPCLGHTPWNHIVWAETWKTLEAAEAAEKIREFMVRYNVIATKECGGIGLDLRGGGSAVRDNLGNPKAPVLPDGSPDPDWNWHNVLKIYDPEDTEGFAHYAGLNEPQEYWDGLRLLRTTNNDNIDWTYAVRAMMQQKKLYIGFWMPPSQWAFNLGLTNSIGEPDKNNPEFLKWKVGYDGIRRLKSQLLRIQRKVSETGVIRFVMPGDREKEEGKRDLWAATIYAGHMAREHIVRMTVVEDDDAPMVPPLLVQIGEHNTGGGIRRIQRLR